MYTITFYSFKGGVGRTLALVNVGVQLARMGRKVLLVDFDLEAPGLVTFDLLRPGKPHNGVVEYVTKYSDALQSPDVRDYLYPVNKKIGKNNGELWEMPAGREDHEYRRSLARLNWKKLYEDKEGFLFFEDTKAQWEEYLKPDYVLVDARTGHTDIEGICTRQLPDAVVVMFVPNEQNRAGLRVVCRHIREEAKKTQEETRSTRAFRLHYVASNVPNLDDEDHILGDELQALRRDADIRPNERISIIHRYESLALLKQLVFVKDRRHSRLARQYRRLVRTLIVENPADRDGALLFVRHFSRLARTMTIEAVGARLNQITHHFWDDAEVLTKVAAAEETAGNPDLAISRLDRALELKPDLLQAIFKRGLLLSKRTNEADAAKAANDLFEFLSTSNNDRLALVERAIRGPIGNREVAWRECLLLDEEWARALNAFLVVGSLGKILEVFFPLRSNLRWGSYYKLRLAGDLVKKRRWKEAIEFLETKGEESLGFGATGPGPFTGMWNESAWRFQNNIHLAMAYWGNTGAMTPPGEAKDICQRALEVYPPAAHQEYVQRVTETDLEGSPHYYQCLSLVWWILEDKEKASEALDAAIQCAERDEWGDMFEYDISFWSYQMASRQEFLKDCGKQRRMIQGERVLPPVLGLS